MNKDHRRIKPHVYYTWTANSDKESEPVSRDPALENFIYTALVVAFILFIMYASTVNVT